MSDNKKKGNYRIPQVQNREELVANLGQVNYDMNMDGILVSMTLSSLESQTEQAISKFGLDQIDRVIIKPKFERDGRRLSEMNAAAVFNLKSGNDIRSATSNNGGGNNAFQNRLMGIANAGRSSNGYGCFVSDKFKQVMGTLAIETTDDGSVPIYEIPNVDSNMARAVYLSYDALLMMALNISNDDCYNFRTLEVIPAGNTYIVNVIKFIDTTRRVKKGHTNMTGINYQMLEQNIFR